MGVVPSICLGFHLRSMKRIRLVPAYRFFSTLLVLATGMVYIKPQVTC